MSTIIAENPAATAAPAKVPAWRTLGWAAFLGASWTWCIGMFVPVLLVRDYGRAAWLVFAVPNVIGAAAMGWVLRTRAASERLTRDHRAACWWFSTVTIGFHLFFAAWIIQRLLPGGGPGALATAAVAAVAFYVAGAGQDHRDLVGACVALAVSLAAMTLFLNLHGVTAPAPGARPTGEVWFLLPVCVVGFALCPYLDLTFHRARQDLPAPQSRTAFTVGFGALFLSMIVFTLLYAPPLAAWLGGHTIRPAVAAVIGLHMLTQTGFTTAIHTRAAGRPTRTLAAAAALSAVMFGLAAVLPRDPALSTGEVTYRLFMAFYALVFPAYLLCHIVSRRRHAARRAMFVASLLFAGPVYAAGFLGGRMAWAAAGAAVLLLVGALALFGSRTREEPS